MPHSASTERQSLRDLDLASQLLDAHRPRRKLMRRVWARSAVALFLHQCPQEGLSVLMIRRADHEGDPWSGHMAFPGGRKDKADRNTLATALRETEEEVGLQAGDVARLLGRLSDVAAHGRLRHGPMVVTPYVFSLPERFPLQANHEVAETVWIPLEFLADRANREKMRWAPNGVPLELPCYLFGGRRIWGLSLMMLDELLEVLS